MVSSDSSAVDTNQSLQFRLLVLVNYRQNFDNAINYLEKNSYKVIVIFNSYEIIESMQKYKPQMILMSWNFKGIDPKRLYKLFTQTLSLQCLVFAEESDTKTSAALLSSGIPNPLLPPISGQAIHARIQTVLGGKVGPKKLKGDVVKRLSKQVSADKIPKHLTWTQAEDPEHQGQLIWHSFNKTDDKGIFGDNYIFRGEKPPEFDPITQKWSYDSSKGGIFIEERRPSLEYKAVQEGTKSHSGMTVIEGVDKTKSAIIVETPSSLDKSFDWNQALSKVEKSLSSALKPEKEDNKPGHAVGLSDDEETVGHVFLDKSEADLKKSEVPSDPPFIASVKEALAKYPDAHKVQAHGHLSTARVTIATVASTAFTGYVAWSTPDESFQTGAMRDFVKKLVEEMGRRKIKLISQAYILEVETENIPVAPWLVSKAEFSFHSHEGKFTLTFFGTDRSPLVIEAQETDLVPVHFDDDIASDTNLPFNTYLFLGNSHKFLLYTNKGQSMSAMTKAKLKKAGIKKLYLRPLDRDLYLEYARAHSIVSTIKD